MRVLVLLASLLITSAVFAKSASCFSKDEKVEVFVVVRDSEVLFFDLEKDLYIPEVKGTLIQGRYLNHQGVTRQLLFPQSHSAWISLILNEKEESIRFGLFGQIEDGELFREIYGADLHCYSDLY
jgi:hypothetical protein